jgi:hypothetical protein
MSPVAAAASLTETHALEQGSQRAADDICALRGSADMPIEVRGMARKIIGNCAIL